MPKRNYPITDIEIPGEVERVRALGEDDIIPGWSACQAIKEAITYEEMELARALLDEFMKPDSINLQTHGVALLTHATAAGNAEAVALLNARGMNRPANVSVSTNESSNENVEDRMGPDMGDAEVPTPLNMTPVASGQSAPVNPTSREQRDKAHNASRMLAAADKERMRQSQIHAHKHRNSTILGGLEKQRVPDKDKEQKRFEQAAKDAGVPVSHITTPTTGRGVHFAAPDVHRQPAQSGSTSSQNTTKPDQKKGPTDNTST